MYRKLQAILNICVVNGACEPAHTPAEFDRTLQQYGPIEDGRYAPLADTRTLGTRITADIVDVQSPYQPDGPEPDYILTG